MNIKIDNPAAFLDSVTSMFSQSKNSELNNLNEDIETGDNSSLLGKIKSNFKDSLEVQTNYKWFFIVLIIGLFFIFLSLLFLPFVAINPQKFLTLFSLGSIIILSSFIFIYGTKEYFNMLCSKERFIFTFCYILSIFMGIYSAYIKDIYILSLISVVVQIVTLVIFTLSFIPGGSSGITFILNMIMSPIKRIFGK